MTPEQERKRAYGFAADAKLVKLSYKALIARCAWCGIDYETKPYDFDLVPEETAKAWERVVQLLLNSI